MSKKTITLIICALIFVSTSLFTQQSAVPEPKDIPYPGTIRLNVDATDIERHIFTVRETVPVRGGEQLVLLFPQWLPGNHSPTGRVDKLGGLIIHANGTRLDWRAESHHRDPLSRGADCGTPGPRRPTRCAPA